MNPAEKVALVTGGARRLGRALSLALARAGSDLVVHYNSSRADADQTVAEIESMGRRAVAVQADLSMVADIRRLIEEVRRSYGRLDILVNSAATFERKPFREIGEAEWDDVLGVTADVSRYEDCARLVSETSRRFGRLDVLINNAGIGTFAPVAEMKPEQWRAVIETNLNSLFYCSHEALPHLKKSGGGWIINIGSLAGKNAFPGGAAYNASKFGLIGFSEALMQEVRQDDVRVSYIMPGSVATEFGGGDGSGAWKIQPEDVAQIVIDLLGMPARTLPSRVEVRPAKPRKN